MNDLYWHQASAHNRQEANHLSQALQEYRQTEHESAVMELAEEKREGEDADDTAISVTRPGMAVFGTPLEPGDFANPVTGGHDTELDYMEVDLFTPFTNTQFENRKRIFWQKESETRRLQTARDTAADGVQALGKEVEALIQRDEVLRNQWEQIEHEADLLLEIQGAPPRRDPTEREKRATWTRKRQQKDIEKRRADLNKRVTKLHAQRGSTTRRHLVLSNKYVSLEKEVEAERSALEMIEAGNDPTLPVVVGRRLDRAGGYTVDGKRHDGLPGVGDGTAGATSSAVPRRAMQMIELSSKYELLNAGSKIALRSFEDAKKMDLATWRLSYQSTAEKAHLESLHNRMAVVEGRLKKMKGDCLRRDLTGAMERFRLNDERLYERSHLIKGQLNWWAGRDQNGCSLVEECYGIEGVEEAGSISTMKEPTILPSGAQGDRGGIQLSDGAKDGMATGKISFPKFARWRVTLVCAKEDPEEIDEALSNDWLEVQLGACEEDRKMFAHFLTRKAPGRFGVIYVKHFEFVGTTLWYRFTFRSEVEEGSRHLALLASNFEQLPEPEYDAISDSRIVSAFVKNLRWEASQPTTRSTTIIQEVTKLDIASTALVDSDVYHQQVLQRFGRKDLRKILLQELDSMHLEDAAAVQAAQKEAELEEDRQRRVAAGETIEEVLASESEAVMDKMFFDERISSEEREALQEKEYKKSKAQRVHESEERYWKRKAVHAQSKVDPNHGFLLVHQKLEIWNKDRQVWRKVASAVFCFFHGIVSC
jgi:hypothetical protein